MLKERESLERSISSPCSSLGGSSGIEVSSCAGCGERIHDRYYLLAVDRQWHASCLKCCECKLPLDSDLTCFARDGNIYCKEDYYRWVYVDVQFYLRVSETGRSRNIIYSSVQNLSSNETSLRLVCTSESFLLSTNLLLQLLWKKHQRINWSFWKKYMNGTLNVKNSQLINF